VWRACAPLRSLSLGTRPSTCASDARARRAALVALDRCTVGGHCTSEKPPSLRRQARAPTCQPCPSPRKVVCACSALARHCARSLWGRGPARALATRARAAPSRRHPLHAPWKGTARARGRRSFGARPVLPRVSPAPHRARWLKRIARLRATAIALSGDEAQHVRFRRERAPRQAGSLGSCTTEEHCTSDRPSFLRRQARAPTCRPCPAPREVACACGALARLCARSLWGRGPARALPTRARRAALATLSPYTMEGQCPSEKPPFLRRQPVLPRASPALTARGGLRV